VAPPEVGIKDIYQGVVPFVLLQGLTLALVFFYPSIALWLPKAIGW
jgi:TRAP-type mannitol/chloroaromatic compound transport system permease large subunit